MSPLEKNIVLLYTDIFLRLQRGYKPSLTELINKILLNKFDESCNYDINYE